MAVSSPSKNLALVVDDEVLVRTLTSEMLQDEGYEVCEARDGQEALTLLQARADSIRVVVSDIAMPELDGLGLAAIVAARWPRIGIVLASGHPPTDLRQKMPEGARFLIKPFREKDLLKAVGAVVRTEVQPGPALVLHNFPLLRAGQLHGSGGLGRPLSEPDE